MLPDDHASINATVLPLPDGGCHGLVMDMCNRQWSDCHVDINWTWMCAFPTLCNKLDCTERVSYPNVPQKYECRCLSPSLVSVVVSLPFFEMFLLRFRWSLAYHSPTQHTLLSQVIELDTLEEVTSGIVQHPAITLDPVIQAHIDQFNNVVINGHVRGDKGRRDCLSLYADTCNPELQDCGVDSSWRWLCKYPTTCDAIECKDSLQYQTVPLQFQCDCLAPNKVTFRLRDGAYPNQLFRFRWDRTPDATEQRAFTSKVISFKTIRANISNKPVVLTVDGYHGNCRHCIVLGKDKLVVFGSSNVINPSFNHPTTQCSGLFADVCDRSEGECLKPEAWRWVCQYNTMCNQLDCKSHSFYPEGETSVECSCQQSNSRNVLFVAFNTSRIENLSLYQFRFRWAANQDTDSDTTTVSKEFQFKSIFLLDHVYIPVTYPANQLHSDDNLLINGYLGRCYQCLVLETDRVVLYGQVLYESSTFMTSRKPCYTVFVDFCSWVDVVQCSKAKWRNMGFFRANCNELDCTGVGEIGVGDTSFYCESSDLKQEIFISIRGALVHENLHVRLRWATAAEMNSEILSVSNVFSFRTAFESGHIIKFLKDKTGLKKEPPSSMIFDLTLRACNDCKQAHNSSIYLYGQARVNTYNWFYSMDHCRTISAQVCQTGCTAEENWTTVCSFPSKCNRLKLRKNVPWMHASHVCASVEDMPDTRLVLGISTTSGVSRSNKYRLVWAAATEKNATSVTSKAIAIEAMFGEYIVHI
ncbi:uncharacterized protein LOC131936199 [Physella acuta]|uniref:uncharacterized protein LOC131936199 n=1 Tax=Physella acuta TaxID=109671 RepID=UPI0027DBD765|nr:uncharacterized protein LOC131936199 [Physella acuta]